MMTSMSSNDLLQRLRTVLVPNESPISDAQLLATFLHDANEEAFTLIVRRYSGMVYSVCRRVLQHTQDTEDAFQATFIVFARKARNIRQRDRLGGWLHEVALRTARELRTMRSKRHSRERQVEVLPDPATETNPQDFALLQHLDDAIAGLPDLYRLPVILCELQGRSRKDVSQTLGIPEGTLSSRLAQAKKTLASRLAKRGVVVSLPTLSTALASSASAQVSTKMLAATVQSALSAVMGRTVDGLLSTQAAIAAEGVMKAMFLAKIKGAVIGLGALFVSFGMLIFLPNSSGVNPGYKLVASELERDQTLATKLVKQLGSSRFAQRVAAEKRLRQLGAQGMLAVKAGQKDDDPEIARRCQALWPDIRDREMTSFAEKFLADKEGKSEFDHPVWQRYKKMMGSDKASRQLFAEMIANPHRAKILSEVEDEPAKAATIYPANITRLGSISQSDVGQQALLVQQKALPTQATGQQGGQPQQVENQAPNPPIQPIIINREEEPNPSDSGITPENRDREIRGELATSLFLGTYPKSHNQAESSVDWRILANPLAVTLSTPNRTVLVRLLSHWLDSRIASASGGVAFLEIGVWRDLKELYPTIRKMLQNDKYPLALRATGLPFAARWGEKTDLPDLEKFLKDTTDVSEGEVRFALHLQAQVRDLAAGVILIFHDQKPEQFGSEGFQVVREWKRDDLRIELFGFSNDENREAAHAKFQTWWKEQKK